MKIYAFGQQNKDTIMLLHGGGMSWWNYKETARLLESSYHVVIPVLDGHADSDAPFTGIEDNAGRIIDFININYGGTILALCGLSLGAQIAVEMMAQKADVCRFAMIESVSLIPSKLTRKLIGPTISSSYFLIKKDWFSRMQFRSLHINEDLYEDYYRDTCKISKKDMVSFLKSNTAYSLPEHIREVEAKTCVIVGGKEQQKMKRSAKVLTDALKNSELHIMDGLYHGELSLNYPERYAELLLELIADK